MAQHPNSESLTIEVVEEYLATAKYCLDFVKPETGGCLGYPATLLLFCVINTMGGYMIREKEPFRVLNTQLFGLNLNPAQIKQIEKWYRNLLAHNGMIAPGTTLSPEPDGDPFGFSSNGEPTLIRVKPFYAIVLKAWKKFNKALIDPAQRPEQSPAILDPRSLASFAMPVASSGSNYIPKVIKL
jgi:hypothetical protein